MFGSQILDVAVGLVFVYLLVSLIVSIVNEWIARLFALRASTLEDGLRNLLQDPGPTVGEASSLLDLIYNHPLVQGASPLRNRAKSYLSLIAVPAGTQTKGLAKSQIGVDRRADAPIVAAHTTATAPLQSQSVIPSDRPQPEFQEQQPQTVQVPGQLAPTPLLLNKAATRTGRPSYIEPRNFSLALLDLVAPVGLHSRNIEQMKTEINQIKNPRLQQTLLVLVNSGQADVESARASIEMWFNNGMDRVSGWYKRKVQIIGLISGLVLAIIINADTFSVVRTLWTQPTVRDALARSAEQYVQKNGVDPKSTLEGQRLTIERSLGELSPTNLPIGWDLQQAAAVDVARPDQTPQSAPPDPRRLTDVLSSPTTLLSKLLGLLLTGAAVSLGAHFWFDTLSRLTSLRSTGDPPSAGTQKHLPMTKP